MSLDLATDEIVYPESDGMPMADNTLQWDWMVKIVGELRMMYRNQEVFVGGDLFWYPIEGDVKTVIAPDVMVAFGRPAGDRGSYKQWEEENQPPHVVFEILSPTNTIRGMLEKYAFCERFGVEEFYVINPLDHSVKGSIRRGDRLKDINNMENFQSPRLGITFVHRDYELFLLGPDGRPFCTREERELEILNEKKRLSDEISDLKLTAAAEKQRADKEAAAKASLAAKLRSLGIDPDSITS